MPGLDSLCGVWDIKHLKSRPREKEARELLEKIADQVRCSVVERVLARGHTRACTGRLIIPAYLKTTPHASAVSSALFR